MKNFATLMRHIVSLGIVLCSFYPKIAEAQLGSRVVIGYFHNWNAAQAPYIRLKDVNPKYNVINIAFATPVSLSDMTMTFSPTQQTKEEFIADMRILQGQGRRVQISIGGAEAPIELKTTADRDKFVTSMKAIITEYGFDGYDIDLEGTSVILDNGDADFKSPTTPKIINLITASRDIINYFRGQGKDFWLTAAPETQYVQGGYGYYGTAYGGYLPVLYALRDLLNFVHVQYYNTGSQVALDERVYSQGTSDFIVSMTDMLLRGFPVARNAANVFPALREDQVAFGLPATNSGAAPAGGYVAPADINKALSYLMKGTSYGGVYVLPKAYPGVRGIMTWSANWDKTLGDAFVNNAYAYFSGLGGNVSPTVSITSPANNANFATGSNITISATASDSDGTVSKVDFYNGATLLGTDTSNPYSFSWTNVAAGSYSLTARATDNLSAATTSTAVNITVSNPVGLPSPWINGDIGSVTAAGSAAYNSGTFTIKGSGADIWGTADGFHYVYQPVSGNVEIVAKVNSLTNTNAWAKAGVMIRESLNANSTHAMVIATPTTNGVSFQRRTTTGGTSASTTAAGVTIPVWVKISRTGNTFTASRSTDGTTWTTIGSATITMTASVYAGLPVTSHANGTLTTATFSNVTVSGPNASPTTSITSPTNNASFVAPASVTINATASDSDGTISKVDFYNGTTLLGTDTSSPYSFSWTNVAAGSYSLTARATDNAGGTGTSGAVNITVNGSNANPTTSITSPANNASFTAPATVTINASASDADGTVSKVDFYNGSTLLGTDTSSPYSFSWTNVAAGSYSLTTLATDNSGATGTSAVVSITVSSNPPPTASITSPVNNATFTAPATVTINATASDNGSVAKVEFFQGITKLGEDTSSPYSFSWTNVAAGTYSLTASATDNLGATGTSSAVNITVSGSGCSDPQYVENGGYVAGSKVKNVGNSYQCRPYPNSGWCNGAAWAYAPGTGTYWQDAWTLIGPCTGSSNNAPAVSITSPANNATFTSGQSVSITASASDSDGSVTKVEFFANGAKIGEDTSSPYSFSWAGSDGSHSLMAKATDNSANSTESTQISITIGAPSNGNLPTRIMVGYWHTWNGGVPFIKLRDVNANWDVINISFAEPVTAGSTDGRMKFVVGGLTADYTINDFKADIQTLKSRGKKIVLSIGGYEGYFSLGSTTAVTQFVNDIKGFINEYGFDGIDIDTEQSSVQFNGGSDPDFKNPTSPKIVNMISAIRQICNSYGSNFILSWAPETFYFQMGKQFYGGLNANVDNRSGVYIPMIHALRDKTTYVHAQLYNSSQMQGPDGQYYSMGTVEGIVAMCQLVLQGFNVNNNTSYFFPPLRADQVVIGVPASAGAAGSGQISNSGLQQAFTTLNNTYPALRGIMSWSINWDALQNSNSFVISNRTYLNGLGSSSSARSTSRGEEDIKVKSQFEEEIADELGLHPNPVVSGGTVHLTLNARYPEVNVSIIDLNGVRHAISSYKDAQEIDVNIPALSSGLHILKVTAGKHIWTKKIISR